MPEEATGVAETVGGSQVALNIGMRVWVTKGVYQGKSGEIIGQVHANSNLYTIHVEGLQGNFQVSRHALSHKPPTARVTTPPQSCKRKVSQESSDLTIVHKKTADSIEIKSESNGLFSYAKGTAMVVVKGTYQGSRGVVQGKARAGNTVLEDQRRVLLTVPKEMNIFLPVKSMRPVSHQSNHVAECLSLFASESKDAVALPTPSLAEINTILNPNSSTHTSFNSQDELNSQSIVHVEIPALIESTQCSSPIPRATPAGQSMGVQCAIFADSGDIKSLFALFR